jgi:excisionase family DNA binding protein
MRFLLSPQFKRFTWLLTYVKLYIMNQTKNKLDKLPDVLTLKQACEILNCHPNTLRNWDNNGFLRAVRFGKRRDRRYKKADILRMLKIKR